MLVVKITKGERIRVSVGGREVWVTVSSWGSGGVKLGFDAPRDVEIDREAVLAKRDREQLDHQIGVR